MASSFGNHLKITIFGQSHSEAIGVTVEGLPVGERVDTEILQAFLARRAPGGNLATSRKEPDVPEILCGLHNGVTCGTPLTLTHCSSIALEILFAHGNIRNASILAVAQRADGP